MKELLPVQEHHSCTQYFYENISSFKLYRLTINDSLPILNKSYHHILFVLKGELNVNCDDFRERRIKSKECVLIPKSSQSSLKAISDCEVIVFSYDRFVIICDKLFFITLASVKEKVDYNFTPIPIRNPLTDFFEILIYYIENGLNCNHLQDLKGQELFLIFRNYYTKEEITDLFYPMIGKTMDFKEMILKNYRKVENVSELASLFHMSRAGFDVKFKAEFGSPPYQWLLKQKAKHIKHDLSDPEVTLGDVINKYSFNSSTHFNRFCKQQFGCTPTELVKQLRE